MELSTECCIYFGTCEKIEKACITHCNSKEEFNKYIEDIKNAILKKLKTLYTKVYEPSDYSKYVLSNSKSKNYSIFIYVGEGLKFYQTEMNKNLFVDYYSCNYSVDIEKELCVDCGKLYQQFYDNIKNRGPVNIIVFDFDDTLVDKNQKIFYNSIWCDLEMYKKYFHYVILWTHGTDTYLSDEMCKIEQTTNFRFQMLIARKRTTEEVENKGLGAVLKKLNSQFGVSKINFSVLVDDKLSNYKLDYDVFVEVKNISNSYYKKILDKLVKKLTKYNKGSFEMNDRLLLKN